MPIRTLIASPSALLTALQGKVNLDRMDLIQTEREEKATAALAALYGKLRELRGDAEVVRRLHEEAGMTLPQTIAALLGPSPGNNRTHDREPRLVVTPPVMPPRPQGAEKDWIWVEQKDLQTTSLVLGLLRGRSEPIDTNALFELVKQVDVHANHGSMLNIGARLDGTIIERSDKGWRLVDPSKAPILHLGYAWGPPGVFLAHEQAAHRRLLILHVLRAAGPKGLGIVETVRRLVDSELCVFPINKDQVKGDMKAMWSEKKVRSIGNPSRWVAVNSDQP